MTARVARAHADRAQLELAQAEKLVADEAIAKCEAEELASNWQDDLDVFELFYNT